MDKIIRHKRREIAGLPAASPVKKRKAGPPLSLEKALTKPGSGFVFEHKRRSPSRGVLQFEATPEKTAKVYKPFADAVSVLTDQKFFGGSYRDLSTMKAAVKVPVLCKDFILDERQIAAAYNAGADAILLMLSILNDRAYMRLSRYARDLGLGTLTEVHDEDEMARALVLGAKLIGINNRDLGTLEVSLGTTRRLAPLVPDRVTVISESGIGGRSDVLGLSRLVDGFLIGTSPMAADEPRLAVRDLAFGRVKICGLTRRRDAREAFNAGAFFGGVNFVNGTPRAISPVKAKSVIGNVPLKWVGVFRGVDVPFVATAARDLKLSAVQLHGKETPEYRHALRQALPNGCEIWQAVAATGPAALVRPSGCDRVLLDNLSGMKFGGTGETFDWRLLDGVGNISDFGLAGGIDKDTVARAAALGPDFIDVCSGAEKAPGIKSQGKMKALFAAIRAVGGRERSLERC